LRRHWNHHAPDNMQPAPDDNTSEYVRGQIAVWAAYGTPVHAESAMEIAAWWHGPNEPAFTAFSHTGTITLDFCGDIRSALHRATRADSPQDDPERAGVELLTLLAYVRTVVAIGGMLA
jgi:hypothetical protein